MKTRIDSNVQKRQNMNWDEVGNNLQQFKDRVQQRWQQLGDDQVSRISGRREALAHELQDAYGLSREEAEAQIREFEAGTQGPVGASSGRGPTERAREFGAGNDQGGLPRNDKHRLH